MTLVDFAKMEGFVGSFQFFLFIQTKKKESNWNYKIIFFKKMNILKKMDG
jgi:hypothetical protein